MRLSTCFQGMPSCSDHALPALAPPYCHSPVPPRPHLKLASTPYCFVFLTYQAPLLRLSHASPDLCHSCLANSTLLVRPCLFLRPHPPQPTKVRLPRSDLATAPLTLLYQANPLSLLAKSYPLCLVATSPCKATLTVGRLGPTCTGPSSPIQVVCYQTRPCSPNKVVPSS